MSAHNDLPLAATWLAAVVAAVAAARSGDALWLAMTVLLSGMAFGIKPNGAAAGGCAGIAFIATLAHPGRLTAVLHGLRRGWPWLVLATLLVALVALPWYIRNAVETGNPLGFMRLRMFGHELPGTIDAAYIAKTTLLHNFHPGDLHHWGWLGASLGVYLGLAWLGLLLPILRWRHWHRGIIGLLVLAAALGWAWIAGPWSAKHEHDPDLSFWMGQQLRYTFALWGVVAALAAAVARPASWLWPVQIIVLWCSVLTGTWITMRVQGAPSLVAPVMASVITVVFAVIIVRGRRPWRRWLPVAVLVALAVLPWVLRDWRLGLRNWYFFGAPSALARLPDDRPIAFWATHQAWLLYGDRLRRQPVFLPLDTAKSDEELARMVLGSGCDHLAIGETWPPTPPDVIERLIAAGVVQPIHGAPRQWGMKILRIIR